jgi:hypothetical protein
MMMNLDREQLGELLSAYLDDEVSAEERSSLEALLQRDTDAQRLLETMRLAAKSMSLLPRHGAPQSIADNIQFHVERSELLGSDGTTPTAQRGRRMIIPAMVSMAAVLGLSVGGLWIMMGEDLPFWGQATQPAATPEKLASVDSIDTEERFASSASMDQKMQAGMLMASARRHAFDNEPVRLNVTARNAQEGDALQREVVAFLRTQEAVDISDTAKADQTIPHRSFYLAGRPGVNFEGTDERQVLVRVPRGDLVQMVDRLTASTRGERRITLAAGPVSVQGAARVRSTLSGLDEAESGRGQVASRSKGGWLEDLIRLAGTEDHALGNERLSVAEPRESIASGAAAPTAVAETKFADARSKYDDAVTAVRVGQEKEQPSEAREGDMSEGNINRDLSPAKDQEPSTAKRKSRRISRGTRARRSRSDEGAGSIKKTEPSPQSKSEHRSAKITRLDTVEEFQSPQDGYVTLIIEIAFDPPRPPRADRGRPPPKPKSKVRSFQ